MVAGAGSHGGGYAAVDDAVQVVCGTDVRGRSLLPMSGGGEAGRDAASVGAAHARTTSHHEQGEEEHGHASYLARVWHPDNTGTAISDEEERGEACGTDGCSNRRHLSAGKLSIDDGKPRAYCLRDELGQVGDVRPVAPTLGIMGAE